MTVAFSKELAQAQTNALKGLSEDPNRHLCLPLRKSIWLAMGPRWTAQSPLNSQLGTLRRIKLAQLSVRHVLDIWFQKWPENQSPRTMLLLAEKLTVHAIDRKTAQMEKDRFWSYLESLVCEQPIPQINVGFAAANVVTTALHDETLDNPLLGDDDLDPYEWDASMYASAAFAGGFPWESASKSNQRYEFWKWWITEATSQAWRL